MSSGMVPLELSKDNNQYCKISVFMPNAGSINESVISVTNVGGNSFSVAVSMIRWNANKVFCKLINGTKVSNINMYYTVDTDRFCFYIKANWYAKIVVSRLGLVNTSKIESINAIPSEAIEVPIYWRDKRYSTDLGELIGVNYLKKAFDYKNIILGSNESYELGICAGLVVIRNIYISAAFSLLLIDEFHNAVTTIAGNSIKELGLEFRFDTTDYKARMSIINVSSNNANIEISYQNLSF